MKNFGIVALSGAALLQVASAACCRSNNCLKAVALADFEGVMDCKSNLIVTVTPSASTYTETVTLVQSAVDTVLFTETTTEIASTETRILTEAITVTSATETDFLTETVTVPYTTTLISLLPEVTSTSTAYQNPIDIETFKVKKARDTLTQIEEANPLPTYATADCADWSQYSKACKCVGVTATTITASVAAVETVTVTASDALTTVVATLSTTSTDIISVTETVSDTKTETVSDTKTETIGATDLITATTTLTISAVETATSTSTPVSVVPLVCKPRGLSFRAHNPFPDGSTRWMNVAGSTAIAWQTFPDTPAPGTASALRSTWVLDSNGYLELAQPVTGQTSVYAAYVLVSDKGATVSVRPKLKADVEAGVAAGTMQRVKGCVNAGTGQLTLSANGRGNMLSCGNGLYLSTGTDGKDVRSDCVYLTPVAA
ncbi:hypothetical protein NEUTE1DRAFT_145675 [Neurospora tetrasperma FGSC 2508]|uniref:Uncharacterized protein n=1 Tax=Neurospora tetrasperma (strain FGSC 2508 / ATCC MYA-4615 / P0657) TaxID=510951 RepID=F8MI27_NEUT8|nr:uncharacterized protein NEUTE1DRAFT_145675 [Neurospora tetrasperma FGSC 2508]EGO59735.1 hypothetical protein NEUTE1DRAFT_145675 [Neurospora tetrasperma FGSC 2508]EGZ73877.1 hypothetical protein NEUTE2DRAFT_108917 [Neurospora tetrasperma FGSC 2509]